MANIIDAIKYIPPKSAINTNEELGHFFFDLKDFYFNLKFCSFDISDLKGNCINNVREFFLRAISGENVIITGNGSVRGININNTSIAYDFSPARQSLEHFFNYKESSCPCIHNKKTSFSDEKSSSNGIVELIENFLNFC